MSNRRAVLPTEGAAERASRLCFVAGFWLPLAVCTWLAFTPSPPDALFRVSDVVLHAFAFTYLTFALALAHPAPDQRSSLWRSVSPAVWMLAYGALIEGVQGLGQDRSAELKDLLVDLAGIALGLLLVRWFGRWTHRLLTRSLGWLLPRGT